MVAVSGTQRMSGQVLTQTRRRSIGRHRERTLFSPVVGVQTSIGGAMRGVRLQRTSRRVQAVSSITAHSKVEVRMGRERRNMQILRTGPS